jgi:hypothetical protein
MVRIVHYGLVRQTTRPEVRTPWPWRVENDRVSFTQEGDIFIRSDEDERNALYSIFQPLSDFDRLLVVRYIFVAENIDFHLVPF